MVRKIINDRDAANCCAHLKPPLHALETRQRLLNRVEADPLTRGQRRRCRCIQRIVFTGQLHFEFSPPCAVVHDLPAREPVLMTQVHNSPIGALGKSVAFHAAERARDALRNVLAAVVGNNDAATRHQVHQPLECCLHRLKIGINIRVIELHVRKNQRIGKVVQKLWAFVEESSVVLVAFDDEGARGPQLKTGFEVFSHASNQKRGLESSIFVRSDLVKPGQHAGGRCLSMRSRNHQRFAAGQKLFAQ